MRTAFDGCDRSKVGKILPEELKELLVMLGEDETDENVWEIMAAAKKGRKNPLSSFMPSFPITQFISLLENDRISFEEFLKALEHHNYSFIASENGDGTVVNPLEKAFLVFDINRDGFITKAEMKTAAKRLNIAELDDQTIEKLFDVADGDNDGRINLEGTMTALS